MIIVIVIEERNERTGRMQKVVSHGIDEATGQTVIMSCGTPESVGAVFDHDIGEYVIRDKE